MHDDALLVASELTTSAVVNATGAADEEFELLAEIVPDGVRIAVLDARSEAPAGRPEPDGLGLRIVQRIARRWGSERSDGGRVWAVLGLG